MKLRVVILYRSYGSWWMPKSKKSDFYRFTRFHISWQFFYWKKNEKTSKRHRCFYWQLRILSTEPHLANAWYFASGKIIKVRLWFLQDHFYNRQKKKTSPISWPSSQSYCLCNFASINWTSLRQSKCFNTSRKLAHLRTKSGRTSFR